MQGLCAALKTVRELIKNKSNNDILMREMLIAVDSVQGQVEALQREADLTPETEAPARHILAVTEEVRDFLSCKGRAPLRGMLFLACWGGGLGRGLIA